jgi:hypothetical protein
MYFKPFKPKDDADDDDSDDSDLRSVPGLAMRRPHRLGS